MNNAGQTQGALLLAIGVGLAVAPGCASRADLVQLRNVQSQMRAAMADQNQDIEELKRRFEVLRSQLADPKASPARQQQAPDQVLRWLDDLTRRVAALEQAQGLAASQPAAPAEGAAPAMSAPPPSGPQLAPPAPLVEASAIQTALAREQASWAGAPVAPEYASALEQIRNGNCRQAVGSLREFVRKNAKSPLADNAQYWIGSCFYQEKDFNRAIIELNEVLLKYPKGDKVPAALLLLADAFKDSGDSIDARLILQKLISDHPTTEEAQLGRKKLQALGE